MKNPLMLLLVGFFLTSCNPVTRPELQQILSSTPPTIKSTLTPKPTATESYRGDLSPTATDIQLPYNLVAESSEYCKPPYVLLPVSDGNDISEDEIIYKLIDLWLRRYKNPGAHPYCRIEDYRIEKVYDDPGIYSQPLEPKGDFMRMVVFSVKLIQAPNTWMSFQGQLDKENWLHMSNAVAATKTNEGYKIQFAFP